MAKPSLPLPLWFDVYDTLDLFTWIGEKWVRYNYGPYGKPQRSRATVPEYVTENDREEPELADNWHDWYEEP